MNEPVNKLTHCTHCRAELMRDEKRGCSYCPRCHPLQKPAPPVKEKPKNYVDVKLTEARVKELIEELVPPMIRDELENWHIQRPPVTKTEIETYLEQHPETPTVTTVDGKPWREQAKELGVPMYDKENKKPRLKVDVIKEIEAKLAELVTV